MKKKTLKFEILKPIIWRALISMILPNVFNPSCRHMTVASGVPHMYSHSSPESTNTVLHPACSGIVVVSIHQPHRTMYSRKFSRVLIFIKSKIQPPNLIFVGLNFVALDDCTCHAPFAIIKQTYWWPSPKWQKQKFSSLILCSIIADRLNRLEADAMRFDHDRVHTRGNFTRWPLPTVANFRGVQISWPLEQSRK